MTKLFECRNVFHAIGRFAALLLIFCAPPVTAATPEAATEHVVAIAADRTLTLAQTGPVVLARSYFPDAELAQGWLGRHLLQQALTFTSLGPDRYGRTRVVSDIEIALMRDGVAVAFGEGPMQPALLAAEAQARAAKRGVWAKPDFVLTPEQTAQHLMEFHLVEGTVRHIYRARNATYLNFGEDWKSDFSLSVMGRSRRAIAALEQVKEGSRVRARGVLFEENGPMLRLTQPNQLELF